MTISRFKLNLCRAHETIESIVISGIKLLMSDHSILAQLKC